MPTPYNPNPQCQTPTTLKLQPSHPEPQGLSPEPPHTRTPKLNPHAGLAGGAVYALIQPRLHPMLCGDARPGKAAAGAQVSYFLSLGPRARIPLGERFGTS